jgi:hypothetical protein
MCLQDGLKVLGGSGDNTAQKKDQGKEGSAHEDLSVF